MTVQLSPGANTSLPAGVVEVTLSWTGRAGVDADVSALQCAGRTVRSDADFVFYNNPGGAGDPVRHLGKSGAALVTDVLSLHVERLDADVDRVVVAASLDAPAGIGFGDLSTAGLSLAVQVGGSPTAVVSLTGFSSETAVVAAEVYRRDRGWKVRAVAQGYDDGLAGLARDFGVSVDGPGTDHPTTGPSWNWRDPPVPVGYLF